VGTMIVNKKLDRLKQWGKERMGGERQTDTNDEFKALEMEMQLRQDGESHMPITYSRRLLI
jgi:hypothetical protein